jgi:hypothetical protein
MPSAAHVHPRGPQRRSAGDARDHERQPDQDLIYAEPTDQPWFPEGGVAAPPYMIVNPLSHGPHSFPGDGTPNELVGPATAEWIKPRASHEQGIGVDPGRRWPRQFHTGAFNFDSLSIMPAPDQIGPIYLANLNRPEKAGWSVPKYGEQYMQSAAERSVADLVQTRDPAGMAFAVGWGYVG